MSSKQYTFAKAICLAALAQAALMGPALAQEEIDNEQVVVLDTVTVTSGKTGETDLQSTPIAITSIGGNEISERAIENIKDLVGVAPGVRVSDLSGYTQLYIRGIGSNIVFIGSDPSSTTHLDGVYMARPLSYLANFLDVERIEVLRGPQGTLYGRNSVGGTINIISRKPSDTFEGEARLTVGDFGRIAASAYLSGPLNDNGVLGSLAIVQSKHDGYLKNVSTGGDQDDENFWGLKGQVIVPLGERADFAFRFDHSVSDSAFGQYPKLLLPTGVPLDDGILDDFWSISADGRSRTVARISGVAGELNFAITDWLSLKSLTAYRKFNGSILVDADSSSVPILRNIIRPIEQSQFSQEFNLVGKMDHLNFIAGAYYFEEDNTEPLTLAVFPASSSHIQRPDLETRSIAVFAQAEYFLTDKLSAVAGIRWTEDKKNYRLDDSWRITTSGDPAIAESGPIIGIPFFPDPFSVDVSDKYSAVTPKFGVNYQLDDALLYVSATRGFKSGGYDYGSTNAVDAAAGFDPEYLWSYEAGAKIDWMEGRVRTNLSAFFYDYSDLQVQSFANLSARTQNAATAEVKGLELELFARPASGLDLSASLAYLDATYSDYAGAFTNTLGTFSADGNRLNQAPEWSGSIAGRYTHDLGASGEFFVGADLAFQSEVFFTAANDGAVAGVSNYAQKQDGYSVLSARVGWTDADDAWSLLLIGENLTETEYVVGTADYTLAIAGRPGPPRNVRLQLTRKF